MVKFIQKFHSSDETVVLSLINRIWSALSSLLTIYFCSLYLDPETQGLYYTFSSLIAFQSVAELGVTFAVTQFCSHEMAKLMWGDNGKIFGDVKARERLQSILHFAIAWFRLAAITVILILIPVGFVFFKNTLNVDNINTKVLIPWIILVTCSGGSLFISGLFAIIEGCGKIKEVLWFKIFQSAISFLSSWIVLVSNGGLYALVTIAATMLVIGSIWLKIKYQYFFEDLLDTSKVTNRVDWKKEIWPFQSRMAVSWIAGVLTFQLINPIVLATEGPIATGKLGMSLHIFTGINSVVLGWITSHLPRYGYLIATGNRQKLDKIFFVGLSRSLIMLVVLILCFLGLVFVLRDRGIAQHERVLELRLLSILGLASISNHITQSEALYLRSHKKEPFMLLSVAAGLIMILGLLVFVPRYGVNGAVFVYFFVTFVIGSCCGSWIFIKFRQNWSA